MFKTVAYHRAADAIGRSPVDLVSAYRAGNPPTIPGVGKAIARQDPRARRRPATWRTTTGSAPRCRRASSSCCGSRGSGPRPSDSSTRSSGSRPSRISAAPPRADACAASAGCRHGPRRSSSRASPSSTSGSTGCGSTAPRSCSTGLIDGAGPDARRPLDRAGRLVPPPEGVDRRPRPARRDRPAGHAGRGVHHVRAGRLGAQSRRLQGGRPADARAAGRPDGHAARRGRAPTASTSPGSKEHNVRLRGHGPRPRLEPVREGLPADRRRRRAADRRRRPSCGRSRPRPRRTRSSACRSSSPSCARTPARSRRPWPAGSRPWSSSATCAATCTATPTGPTATSRSRSWPRPPEPGATPTRS